MSSLKPSILLLSLSQLGMEESNDHLYTALRQRAELAHLSTAQAAIKRLARTPTPQAVIVTDAGVTEPDNCNVLERLVSYAKGGGIVVFACQFSSFVKYDDLSAMFTVMWKLPWTAGDYGRRDLRLNRAAKCVDTGKLVQKLYTKVLQLANVSREDAIYRSANTHSRAGDTISTPAAYTAIERGRVGFIGDVNFIPEFTRVILEMCFPKHLPSTSSGPETTSPSVLILSLNKESWTEESYAQLYRGLRKNATVSEVLSANAAKHALNNSSPSAVLVTDAAIHERKHRSLLAQVIQYARAGGRVVLGLNFSNHFTLGSGPQFFSQWGFPSWDVGSYHRSTFALNPAGVPTPLNSNALFSEYSMKTLHITGINTREDAVYLPTESSHVESMVFPNVQITGSGLEESPAVFARVGDGYLGYVGDVNGEQPSIRLLIEMCGVKVKAGDLGAELRTAEVTLHPDGTVDAVKETILEKPLPVPRAPRAREAEVVARAAKRAANSRAKAVKAEKLKTEGNTLFGRGKYVEAAELYRKAALEYKPLPVFLTNLAQALLKLERWVLAESAAERALRLEPTNIKARYRRGLALREQGKYLDAIKDFRCVLRLDPLNASARQELENTLKLYIGPVPGDDRREDPVADESAKSDIITESDSEDYKHSGNAVFGNKTPCRFYNHEGCNKGAQCRYRHAPDEKSLRDDLGRNVCVYWLFDRCRYGAKCAYAHDKTYLRLSRRWKDKEFIRHLQTLYDRFEMPSINTLAIMGHLWSSWRTEMWATASYNPKEPPRGEELLRILNLGPYDPSPVEEDEDEDYMDEDDRYELDAEMEERALNCGFSHDEVNELLSHGVKPWDDDAWDFMDALRNLQEEY